MNLYAQLGCGPPEFPNAAWGPPHDQKFQVRARLVLGRYNAPAAIVVCGDRRRALPPPVRHFWIEDCSAATENILLAAPALGLGTVWIGVYPIGPLVLAVRRVLSLPRHVVSRGHPVFFYF